MLISPKCASLKMNTAKAEFRLLPQPSLFQITCPDCQLWDSCGGAVSAPCQCVWVDERRHQCGTCNIICRERYVVLEDGKVDTLASRLLDVTPLDELRLEQHLDIFSFPVFIPDQTYNLPEDVTLNCEWAAIGLKRLISQPRDLPARPHSWLARSSFVRQKARVGKNSRLLAIFNAKDDLLESFWGMERLEFYDALVASKFDAVTGPTFSINKFASEDNKTRIPDSHSAMMLNRHHRVMTELAERFCVPIPNIYWRNDKDLEKWRKWLMRNENVFCIYRDFSATKGEDYEQFLDDLFDMVSAVDRPLHLLATGIGCARAATVVRKFADVGCKVSIISSDPIVKGNKNKALVYKGENRPDVIPMPDQKLSEIAVANVRVMEQHLRAVTDALPTYSTTSGSISRAYKFDTFMHDGLKQLTS